MMSWFNNKEKREQRELAYTISNNGVCVKCLYCAWLICKTKTIIEYPSPSFRYLGPIESKVFDKNKPSFCGYNYKKNKDRSVLRTGCENYIKTTEER